MVASMMTSMIKYDLDHCGVHLSGAIRHAPMANTAPCRGINFWPIPNSPPLKNSQFNSEHSPHAGVSNFGRHTHTHHCHSTKKVAAWVSSPHRSATFAPFLPPLNTLRKVLHCSWSEPYADPLFEASQVPVTDQSQTDRAAHWC